MPRNVATPEQSAQAAQEIGLKGKGFGRLASENRIAGVRPLRKADRRVLEENDPPIYIYNVSPVWSWPRQLMRKGTVMIPRRGKPPAKVSAPLIIPGAIVADYDAGNRFRQQYVEDGVSVAEDILCCSKEMPGLPQNDLTGYGCFYLIGMKFEDLPQDEQDRIFQEASQKHENKCREKVLEADQLADSERTRPWITEVYRLCAHFLGEECGDKSALDRRWVSKRGRSSPVAECPFCGYEAKKGLAKCPNCHEITDQELYDSLKMRKPKTPKAQPSAEA